jgi:hypothetical protein
MNLIPQFFKTAASALNGTFQMADDISYSGQALTGILRKELEHHAAMQAEEARRELEALKGQAS